jgi:septum formation protein
MPNSERIPFILASGSPRRKELLERFWGQGHIQILVPDFDESVMMASAHARIDSRSLVSKLAEGKLLALHAQYSLPEAYAALAADTVVVLDDQIMGKPDGREEAKHMLNMLSGRTHQVISGISLEVVVSQQLLSLQASEVTHVRFARLSDEQINWYVMTHEPFDKAGAYGIQGYGAAFVKQIDGCYYNVMGLPVNRLMVMLQQAQDHFSSCSSDIRLLPWNRQSSC